MPKMPVSFHVWWFNERIISLIVLCLFSGLIDEEPLRFRGEVYHGYHFSCTACGTELDSTAREVKSRPGLAANDMVGKAKETILCQPFIYFLNRTNSTVCAATIKWAFLFAALVVGPLRNVWLRRWASTGMWSTLCAPSARSPSWATGTTRSEDWPTARRTTTSCSAICALSATRSSVAMVSHSVLSVVSPQVLIQCFQTVFTALNKAWCVHHFACSVCDTKMTQKSKFYEYDEKPVCKKCYERFPNELRRRLRTAHEMTMKKNP